MSIENLINDIKNGNNVAANSTFDSVIADKVTAALDAKKIEVAGVTQECGGMDIRLNVQQLPQKMIEKYLSVSRDLKLTQGTERRLFVRVTQEDGHQAWTSPFYILRS